MPSQQCVNIGNITDQGDIHLGTFKAELLTFAPQDEGKHTLFDLGQNRILKCLWKLVYYDNVFYC